MPLDDAVLRQRLWPAPLAWEATPHRLAAVIAPLFVQDGEDCLLFTVRPAHLRQHPGQIGFPGGMRDDEEGPLQCALREYREELGLSTERVAVLGGLPARSSSAGIHVHTLVARVPAPLDLRLCAREVDRVLVVPLAELRDESRWQVKLPPPPSPHFAVGDDVIWGLTGRLCWDLVTALRGV
jgi:8-oxo-dGTP pyrophosphatase MutT (NUDIX family)